MTGISIMTFTPPSPSLSGVRPFVRVVVLNYDGGPMTLRCLDTLRAQSYPPERFEVVLVDNASVDGLAPRVRAEYPWVRFIEELENHGFAGGCNLGMGSLDGVDYIALFNNDAEADPGWLTALVNAAEADATIGAVCSKMLFADQFFGVAVHADLSPHPSSNRWKVGVAITGVKVDGVARWDDLAWGEKWQVLPYIDDPDEPPAKWSLGPVEVRVAATAGATPRQMSLRLAAPTERTVRLDSGTGPVAVQVGPTPKWFDVVLTDEPFDVIQNVGSALYPGGFGGDRGFLQRDHGQFETPADVFAWCGGSVLLRHAYLEHAGRFDDRFFVYYEDTDLSWRGRLLGWNYRYEPTSLVRHHHAQSSGVGSDVFLFHTTRNRLLVLAKLAPVGVAARGVAVEMRILASLVLAEIVRPITRVSKPVPRRTKLQLKVLRSFVTMLPAMVHDRRELGRRATQKRRAMMKWTITK
jgi:GT2 family glycosyltransferase